MSLDEKTSKRTKIIARPGSINSTANEMGANRIRNRERKTKNESSEKKLIYLFPAVR